MDDDPLSPSKRSIFDDLEGVISEELVVQGRATHFQACRRIGGNIREF